MFYTKDSEILVKTRGRLKVMLSTNNNLNELTKGEWNVLQNQGDLSFEYLLIKPEGNQVSLMYVNSNLNDVLGVQPMLYVIHEEIFKYDTNLAHFSLRNINIDELLELVVENTLNEDEFSDLVFNLLHVGEERLENQYTNYQTLRKFAYTLEESDLSTLGLPLVNGVDVTRK